MLKLKLFFFVGLLVLCNACSKNSDGGTDTSTQSPSLRISDVQLFRNNVAPTTFHFVVTVDKESSKEIKVDYATVDGNTNGDEYTK